MRVLVTGAAGQLGNDVVTHCGEMGDDVHACDRSSLDIGDRDAVHAAVGALRPDVVVNTAAWTAVDACEGDRDRAMPLVEGLGSAHGTFEEVATALRRDASIEPALRAAALDLVLQRAAVADRTPP